MVTASIAAGCGGTRPCTTESAGDHGQADQDQRSVPVRRATVNAMGMSRTKPTSKKAGRPTIRPMHHHGPGHMLLAEDADQRIRDAVRGRRIRPSSCPAWCRGQQRSRCGPRVLPTPVSKERITSCQRHTRDNGERQRSDQQREERVELEPPRSSRISPMTATSALSNRKMLWRSIIALAGSGR